MNLVSVAPQRADLSAEPGLLGRPLTPIEAALLRMLDTADAIEAGRLPAHLDEPPASAAAPADAAPAAISAPVSDDDGPSWVARVRNVVMVWTVVAALGVVGFEVAPGPARPRLAPAPPAGAHPAGAHPAGAHPAVFR